MLGQIHAVSHISNPQSKTMCYLNGGGGYVFHRKSHAQTMAEPRPLLEKDVMQRESIIQEKDGMQPIQFLDTPLVTEHSEQ